MYQSKLTLFKTNDPKIIAAMVIFVLAFLAFIYELVSGFSSVEQIKADKPLSLSSTQKPIQKNSPLFTTPLFGNYVPANLSDAEIKQSTLDVQVVGIMFANTEKESQVILKVGGGKEETYVLGDTLPGGAVIKRISPEGVVVLHDGALESLSLPKNELIFDVPAKPLVND